MSEQEVQTIDKGMCVCVWCNNVCSNSHTYKCSEVTPPSSVKDTPPVVQFEEKEDEVQLEPTQDEMERERLMTKAEQVSFVKKSTIYFTHLLYYLHMHKMS